MKPGLKLALILSVPLIESGCRAQAPTPTEPLLVNDYDSFEDDRVIHLDAEDLAEEGMKEAYEELGPRLRKLGVSPEAIHETVDTDAPSYQVHFRGRTYQIWDADPDEGRSWGTAAAVFFEIVNSQLAGKSHRFYALNHGNDLSGIFLTDEQYRQESAATRRATDRPFIPTATPPWFGQPHD